MQVGLQPSSGTRATHATHPRVSYQRHLCAKFILRRANWVGSRSVSWPRPVLVARRRSAKIHFGLLLRLRSDAPVLGRVCFASPLEDEPEAYDDFGFGGATELASEMVALQEEGGMFPVADYVGPELAGYARADPPTCNKNNSYPVTPLRSLPRSTVAQIAALLEKIL